MKNLSTEGFNRARDFLLSEARPLEKATYELEFEEGSVDEVLTQLAKFQNPDGGFGMALEPDIRTTTSSALCTEMGLRYMAEMNISADNPMVGAAISYLLESFSEDAQVWRVVPQDANEYPHAPWWHDEIGSLARTFDDFLVIPRAGILALLYCYAELVPADWLAVLTETTVGDIEQMETEKFGGGGDTLVYALRLAEAPGLAINFKTSLVTHLRDVADQIVARDPRAWSGYAAPPLKLSPTPDTLFADLLMDDLQVHLDYVIEHQTQAGNWEPTWHWGEFYPKEWEQAKQEWCGILTLDMLISLRAFERIEV
jgi:hypothetical protein